MNPAFKTIIFSNDGFLRSVNKLVKQSNLEKKVPFSVYLEYSLVTWQTTPLHQGAFHTCIPSLSPPIRMSPCQAQQKIGELKLESNQVSLRNMARQKTLGTICQTVKQMDSPPPHSFSWRLPLSLPPHQHWADAGTIGPSHSKPYDHPLCYPSPFPSWEEGKLSRVKSVETGLQAPLPLLAADYHIY